MQKKSFKETEIIILPQWNQNILHEHILNDRKQ